MKFNVRAIHYFRLVALALAGTLMTLALEPPPVFRTSTNLVEFNVVVQDRNGKPITDLKKEEVSIFENDQPRQTAVFRFSGGAQNSDHPQPLPAGVFSNRLDTPGAPRNFVAIVFDALNTPTADKLRSQASLHEQMRKYFTKLPPNTRAATYLLKNNVRMLHDFTDDFEALRASMVKTDNDPPPQLWLSDDPASQFGFRTPLGAAAAEAGGGAGPVQDAKGYYNNALIDRKLELTMAGLEAIGNQLAGLPGRKSLVLASSGMTLGIAADLLPGDRFGTSGQFLKPFRPALEKTARRLASQGVAIYSVWGGGPAMDILSDTTGGRVVEGLNDPARGITVAIADQDASYSLGFYTGEPDAQWHNLKVKVSRPGAKVLYQQGYMSAAPVAKQQEWSDAQWRTAATNPLGSTVIRFDANAHLVAGALQANFVIAADDLRFQNGASEFDVALVEGTSGVLTDLRHVESSIQLPESALGKGTRVSAVQHWNINPQSTNIRLIVHDRLTGAWGSVDIPVTKIPAETTH